MRNAFARSLKNTIEIVRSKLAGLFKTTNIKVTRSIRDDLVNKYSDQYSSMVEYLHQDFED